MVILSLFGDLTVADMLEAIKEFIKENPVSILTHGFMFVLGFTFGWGAIGKLYEKLDEKEKHKEKS